MSRVLLIEDEEMLGSLIKEGLEASHYTVTWETNGLTGLARAGEGGFALVLLDLMLPGLPGWDICQGIRRRRDTTPILMLTARDSVDDRVRGLDIGADDYLAKPFDFKELRARVRALIRREHVHRADTIYIADLVVNTHARTLTMRGHDVPLTNREYTLLEALATNEGRILSPRHILEQVWDDDAASNTVEVYVSMLRKKIDAGRTPQDRLIRTIRGLGYRLRDPERNREQA